LEQKRTATNFNSEKGGLWNEQSLVLGLGKAEESGKHILGTLSQCRIICTSAFKLKLLEKWSFGDVD